MGGWVGGWEDVLFLGGGNQTIHVVLESSVEEGSGGVGGGTKSACISVYGFWVNGWVGGEKAVEGSEVVRSVPASLFMDFGWVGGWVE